MTDEQGVKRYDCTSGGAQFCNGCYQMEEDEMGDYVRWEDYERLRNALLVCAAVGMRKNRNAIVQTMRETARTALGLS